MKVIDQSVTLTPRLIAEGFWELDAAKQAEFFEQLGIVIKEDCGDEAGYRMGFQFAAMQNELANSPEANKIACEMTAYIFNKASDFLSRNV